RHQRRVTFSLGGILVRNDEVRAFVEAVGQGTGAGVGIDVRDHYHQFLGGVVWGPSFGELAEDARAELDDPRVSDSIQRSWFHGVKFPVAHTVMRYSHEGQGFDCSLPESVSGYTPSLWMARRMGLSWGRSCFRYVDSAGRIVAFDPSHEESGPGAFLV